MVKPRRFYRQSLRFIARMRSCHCWMAARSVESTGISSVPVGLTCSREKRGRYQPGWAGSTKIIRSAARSATSDGLPLFTILARMKCGETTTGNLSPIQTVCKGGTGLGEGSLRFLKVRGGGKLGLIEFGSELRASAIEVSELILSAQRLRGSFRWLYRDLDGP